MIRGVRTRKEQRTQSHGLCPETGTVRWIELVPGPQTLTTILREWRVELGHYEQAHISIGVCCHGRKEKIVLVSTAFLSQKDGSFDDTKFKKVGEFLARVEQWWRQQYKGLPKKNKILVTPRTDHELDLSVI